MWGFFSTEAKVVFCEIRILFTESCIYLYLVHRGDYIPFCLEYFILKAFTHTSGTEVNFCSLNSELIVGSNISALLSALMSNTIIRGGSWTKHGPQ